jgi:hypothetical protein
VPNQDEAKTIYNAIKKNGKLYDRLNEEGKKAYWQYSADRKLVSIDQLNDSGKAEYQRYVNPNKPEYAMQASVVQTKPSQYIQTQTEKVMSAVTPSIVKNMISQDPEQIAANQKRKLVEQRLEEYTPPQPMKPQLPQITNKGSAVVQQGKVPQKGLIRPDNPFAPAPVNALNTASLGLLERNTDAISSLREKAPIASTVGSMAGYLAPFGAAKGALVKGSQTLGKRLLTDAAIGAGVDASSELIKGKNDIGTATKNVAIGAGTGILADGALTLIGKAVRGFRAGQLAKIPVEEIATAKADIQPTSNVISKGQYKVRNTRLTKAIEEYNTAIETIQNHFQTNELRSDEMSRIKTELGIDIDSILKNMEDAEKGIDIREIGEQRNLANVAGVKTAPKLTKPDALQSPTNDLPKQGNINTLPIPKPLATVATAKPIKTVKEVMETAPAKKDISGFQAYTTDVYRNFEEVFGEDFPAVKKEVLDPFDAAKKAKTVEDRQLMSDLKKNIVDKFNIQKGSKDSALVQQFGEKRISEAELIAKVGKSKADKIVEADKYFRSTYDRLIDEVNVAREIVYPNNPEKIIPRRADYYRHFKELSDDFAGLKNIFETPSQISPSLAGMSEFTKPKSKFLSFAQKRGNGEFTDDAVGGFLDYINAATYAKHIDTQIPKFRGLAADLAEATEQSKNMNNFIGYLTDFANDLSGKTNPADRFVQKIIPGGRMTFKAINWLNNRVKANTILGNVSSSLSQIANIPQGIAYVKDPVSLSKGAGNYLGSIFGKGDAALYKKSGFLLERYADNVARQFDVKILDQPKKAAAWMLGALDEMGTKFIWSSTYQKALADGVKDPIKYADDVAKKLVGGRGIGEVPLLQKSKIMQLVAPFTLEVNNLWKVQKDFVKAGDFGGLALLYLANFALNKGMEEVRGNGVVFDPIQAIYEATTEEDLGVAERAGRVGGEVLSNMPLGSTLATLYPEYGISNDFADLPTREKLFGRNDPTRFGGGLLAVKGLQDPLYKVAPSFGGGQIKKTVQAGQDLGLLPKLKKQEGKILPKLEKQDLPASYSNTKQGDRMRTTIAPKLSSIAKGLAFGRGAIPEVKKYYESGKVPLGTKQTENIKKLIDKGYDPNKLFETLNGIRGTSKKNDIVVKLRESGYNSREINEIWEIFYK